jgi:hypothetical protein
VQHVIERPEHDPAPALAENLEYLVVPDPAERIGARGWLEEPKRHLIVGLWATLVPNRPGGCGARIVRRDRRVIEEAVWPTVGAEQRFDPLS